MNDIKEVKRRIAELREKHHLDPNDESIINSLIGARIRFVRLLRGKTQTKVANAIGVTFQQIQKYEKGANGTSSGPDAQNRVFGSGGKGIVIIRYKFQ